MSRTAPWYKFKTLRKQGRLEDLEADCIADGFGHFYDGCHIDPRSWFCELVETEPCIPQALADVLFKLLLTANVESISMFGRCDCQLPNDWTLPLVKRLVDVGIEVVDDSTCPGLNHPKLSGYSRDEHGNYKPPRNSQ